MKSSKISKEKLFKDITPIKSIDEIKSYDGGDYILHFRDFYLAPDLSQRKEGFHAYIHFKDSEDRGHIGINFLKPSYKPITGINEEGIYLLNTHQVSGANNLYDRDLPNLFYCSNKTPLARLFNKIR